MSIRSRRVSALALWIAGAAATLASVACAPDAKPAADPQTAAAGAGGAAAPAGAEQLLFSIVWMGGCREGNKEWNPATNPSSANVGQLSQTLTDLAALPQTPRYFFFPGDLVLGLSDTPTLTSQLTAWTTLYKNHPSGLAAKTTLVPIMGNHESLVFKGKEEIPNPTADAAFASWMTASGFAAHAGNGPTTATPNADALAVDESKLTYSFDDGPVHFVVFNSDTLTTTPDPTIPGTTQIGWIPIHWIQADVEAAQARPSTKIIFLLAHKLLIRPDHRGERGDAINEAQNAQLVQLIDRNSKVKAYLTSHDHLWDAQRLPGSRAVWQITSGNGGSDYDRAWKEVKPYFGYTVVQIYDSGRIVLTPYARPIPKPYDSLTTEPAKPRDSITIGP